MTAARYLDGRVHVHAGDCLDVIRTLADNSIDSCVTDPPYGLEFMGKDWDTGARAFDPELWREVLCVLKPGGHLLAFGGARTYHRLACAIEDAGFEVRDQIGWAFGSGFPKSHDVSKGIDKAAGAERHVIGRDNKGEGWGKGSTNAFEGAFGYSKEYDITAPSTPDAIRWSGWGTALKPAWEPICMARKPLEGTVAANVLKHGTGAINVDGCRIPGEVPKPGNVNPTNLSGANGIYGIDKRASRQAEWEPSSAGRWPANLIHDGSDEVVAAFPESNGQQGNIRGTEPSAPAKGDVVYGFRERVAFDARNDAGSAARFFYSAKADSDDRLGSKHPTVKPVDLMQYLVRLVTPKGGLVLDPFAGTGTTGEAAIREGCRAVLIEREPEYLADIVRRCSLILAGPDTRLHATIKAKGKAEEPLPLFAEERPQ